MFLASASNDIKILKLPELEIVRSFAPHTLYTNCLAWNCDNTCLASCGAECDIQLHSDAANAGKSAKLGADAKHNLLRFSNKSPQMMSTSGGNGLTMLWDTVKMVPTQAFKDLPSKPLSMVFSPDDSVLSVGCDSGHLGNGICMYDLKKVANVHAMTPIDFANIEGALKIEYSYYEKDTMACGSSLGNVHIIDTMKAKVVHKFEAPVECPCADLSFSTINDLLLVSLNKNGQLGFYDINSKTSIKFVETGFKTTCMKMLEDGTTLIVGTSGGRLEVFDLRAKFVSINSIKAHTVSVRSVSVQKKPLKSSTPTERCRTKDFRKASESDTISTLVRLGSKDSGSLKGEFSDSQHSLNEKASTTGRADLGARKKKNSVSTVCSEEVETLKRQRIETSSLRMERGDNKTTDTYEIAQLRESFEKSVEHMLRDFKEDMHADLKHIYCSIITQFYDMKTHLTTNLELAERVKKLEQENKELEAAIKQLKSG